MSETTQEVVPEMFCPVCRKKVIKGSKADIEKLPVICENEFYVHAGEYLHRIKHPQTLWT